MRIVYETQGTIILKDRNIFSYVVAFIFLIVGAGIILKPEIFTTETKLWMGIVMVVIGIVVILSVKVTTITFDKASRKFMRMQKSFIKTTKEEHDLNVIKEVELSASYSYTYRRSGNSRGGYSYHVNLILNDGGIIELNPGRSTVRIFAQQIVTERKWGTKIAAFLGVPFQERKPLAPGETLQYISSAIEHAINEAKKEKE